MNTKARCACCDVGSPSGSKGEGQSDRKKSNGSVGGVDWSSDHETDSDDSLQPYDLSEADDDGTFAFQCITQKQMI